MNTPRIARVAVWQIALVTGLTAPAATATEARRLAAAVPDDVFLCISGRHNPERKFLDDYWGDVFTALKASGVGTDLLELIGGRLGDEQKAEMLRIKALATELINGVDWQDLAGKEMVYAQRMPAPAQQGQNLNMGPPDMLWLFRGTEDGAARNFDGLLAILQTVVAEVNMASGELGVAVDLREKMGAKVASLTVKQIPVEDMPFTLSIARHGDVVAISAGRKLLLESLSLLDGKQIKTPITESPRYQQAFEQLPESEDSQVFFDMQAMLEPMRKLTTLARSAMESSVDDAVTNDRLTDEGNALNQQAIEAYQNNDYPKALALIRKAHEAAPTDSLIMYNVACFESLNGNKEEAVGWLERSVDAGFYAPKQIGGDDDLKSLRGDARYEAALKKATDMAAKNPKSGDDEKAWLALAERVMNLPAMLDYVATVEYTEGHATHTETVTVLAPGAQEQPFYKVVGGQKPLTSFARFLPEESVSFTVSRALDFDALYAFIEGEVRSHVPNGEAILQQWSGLQQQIGVDLRRDLLSWLGGELISVAVETGTGRGSVYMLGVKDEDAARQKLSAALEFASAKLQELATQNPMMAMLAVRTSPCTHEKLDGFTNIMFGMTPKPWVLGVKDGYIILGAGADPIAMVLATADGQHPNVTKNPRFMKEGVVPEAAFQSMTYSDQRAFGQELAQAIGIVSMIGGMAVMAIPEPEEQQLAGKLLGMIAKLGPVAGKIDFYQSTASCTTFDGKSWRTRQVTNYRAPTKTAER